MGKASRFKAAARAVRFVVRVGYVDGTQDVSGFASREQAKKMVDVVRPLVDGAEVDEGISFLELVECASGAVEFRAARELRP